MKYLIDLRGTKHVVSRSVELPSKLLYSANAVYREVGDSGDYVCVKNRDGMLQPLSKEEATMWMLVAEYIDLSQYTLNI